MSQNIDKQTGKRPYSKPKIKEVQFVKEEVVFAGCKTTRFDTSGPSNKWCMHQQCSTTTGS